MSEPPIDERYELAAVKDSLTPDERTTAEKTYTRRAFDYEQNPVGSRDWTLFWSGWCARATQPSKAQPPCVADGAEVGDTLQGVIADMDAMASEGWSECGRAAAYLRALLASQPAAPVAPATVAVPAEVARSVQVLRAHNEWRRGNKTESWEPIPYSPAELGRAIDIVCDHATHTAKPDLLKRATDYAHDIVTWLHRDHYSENTRFKPFGDLLGLLSQIDNMICGWKEATPPVSADSAMLEEERAK